MLQLAVLGRSRACLTARAFSPSCTLACALPCHAAEAGGEGAQVRGVGQEGG